MPAEDALDTLATGGAGTQQDGAPAPETDADTAEPKLFFGKYKSEEEAGKAHAELEKTLGRQGDELGELRKQNAKLQSDVLAKLAAREEASAASAAEPEKPPEWDEFVDKLDSKYRDEDGNLDAKGFQREAGRVYAAWVADQDRRSRKYADDKIAELVAKMESFGNALEKVDPAYTKHSETVDKLMETHNLTLAQAKALAPEIDKLKAPSQPDRQTPPGGGPNGRTTTTDNGPILTDAEKAHYRSQGHSDEEIAALEKRIKAEKKKEGQ